MPWFTISALTVAAAFVLIGMSAAKRVRTASDYAVAGRSAGASSVAGVIMGALVAGGSTIGTVQMAYEWGLSACWFTLGSGIGCAVLGIWFARPVRHSGLSTLPAFLERAYGYPTSLLTMISSILGTLLSVVSQFLAGYALLRSLFPASQETAAVILSVMILAFIFAGGLRSYSAVGAAKTALLYILMALCCVRAVTLGQGAAALFGGLPFDPWFNPFGRGVGPGVGACASLVTGVLCTQIYMQAVFSASGEAAARRGCLLAACLIPPLGLMAVWIGIAMRNAGIGVEAAQALPYFLNAYFHPAVSGIFWAGLAITVIGGASGLCLGIATNLSLDIVPRIAGLKRDDRRVLSLHRAAVFATVAAAAVMALRMESAYILQLSYIGMGLRGAGMAIPLAAAILKPGRLSRRGAFASALAGLVFMMLSWVCLPDVEPLFVGLTASAVAALPFFSRKREANIS